MTNNQKLLNCFKEALGVPLATITDDLAYQSIKQWDSVAHMALVAALESEFNVMMDTDQILALSTVRAAREILTKLGVDFQ